MTQRPDSVPQRIGDADRDQAAGYLREHLAAGRISQEEFDERVGVVLGAKYAADIEAVFHDLPAPRPGNAPTSTVQAWPAYPTAPSGLAPRTPPRTPAPSTAAITALNVAAAVTWPVVLIFLFATGSWGSLWWLIFVPIAVSAARGQLEKGR